MLTLYRSLALSILGLWPSLALAATITFSWEPGVGGDTPTGYVMQRKSGAGAYAEVGRTPAPPFTDTVVAATTTCWVVRAYNALAESPPSNEVCLNVPKTPINLVIVISGPSVSAAPISATTTIRRRK